ncbi:hypothetical protein JHK85_009287 [Glycine max]|nr:hypothetical protein JHK85_009287 [Glycine max]
MANRDQPVNGKDSKISLLRNGNLALNDVDESLVWYTNTASLSSSVRLFFDNTGNLLLHETQATGVK